MFSCKNEYKESDKYNPYKNNKITFWFEKENLNIKRFVFKKYKSDGKLDVLIDSFQIDRSKIHYNKIENITTIDVENVDYYDDICLVIHYKNGKKKDYKFSKIIAESLEVVFENEKSGHISKIKSYIYNNKIYREDSCNFLLPNGAEMPAAQRLPMPEDSRKNKRSLKLRDCFAFYDKIQLKNVKCLRIPSNLDFFVST